MEKNNLIKTSKFISLILRHKPETIGIKLDEHGWADVEDLLKGIDIDCSTLEQIVKEDEKGRYSFSDDKTKIRANQGHSINVDVELEEKIPPNVLYHGTAEKYLDNINLEGLKPMSRLYVHLTEDLEIAKKTGQRHGKLVIFEIDAKRMIDDGIKFYLSVNNVWLVRTVPPKYLSRMK